MVRPLAAMLLLLAGSVGTIDAQATSSLEMERNGYAAWLTSAATSPLAAVAMNRLSGPVTLGPDTADIPLAGFAPATVTERNGAVTLTSQDGKRRPLPAGRPVAIAPWTLQALRAGTGTAVLMVYGKPGGTAPGWYREDAAFSFALALEPPASRDRKRVLTLDGIEVEAEPAGYLAVPIGGVTTRLQVMRMPIPGTEESELQVYFRDQTNDKGTYPAGRFVEVTRTAAGTYRLDLNRARNPFCAYSSVYPCPVPWSGNTLPASVTAGEKYLPVKPGS